MVVTYLFIAVNVAVFLSLRFKMIPAAGVTLSLLLFLERNNIPGSLLPDFHICTHCIF
jgi:hypothetical protein